MYTGPYKYSMWIFAKKHPQMKIKGITLLWESKVLNRCILVFCLHFFYRSNIKQTGTDSCSIYSTEIMSSLKNKFVGAAKNLLIAQCGVYTAGTRQPVANSMDLDRTYVLKIKHTHTQLIKSLILIHCCHWVYLFIAFIWYTVVMAHSSTASARSLCTKAL